jgi:hypothetical protein
VHEANSGGVFYAGSKIETRSRVVPRWSPYREVTTYPTP